ncbi:MAG TPA: I78 family peptidase inhibitor [Sphingomicrobium sp.]|nr:I78 family peptidase inhibitor [Sphingomicrobium sp.]
MHLFLAGAAAIALTACTIAESDPVPGLPEGNCRSEALGKFIGKPAGQDLGARMLAASGAKIIRWVPKGGMVTMDFSPNRLTVQLDANNRVETANCG